MRRVVLAMVMLFALGDSCSPAPGVVGVQDYGLVTGRVLDAMNNHPIPNALVSVGSLYTASADARGAFVLSKVPAGDQTVTARAAGYTYGTAPVTVLKSRTVSAGYVRLVPLVKPAGEPTLPPPATPSPVPSAEVTPTPQPTVEPAPGVAPTPGGQPVIAPPTPAPGELPPSPGASP